MALLCGKSGMKRDSRERFAYQGRRNRGKGVQWEGGGTVRQAVGVVQSLELHQQKTAMVLSTILIKNKVFLHYKMFFYEI